MALVFFGPFLNVHVHPPAGAEVERADVNLAADELEREAVTGNEETGFSWASDRGPRALDLIEIAACACLGRGGGRKGWHGEAPIKFHRLAGKFKLLVAADRGEGLPKLVRL